MEEDNLLKVERRRVQRKVGEAAILSSYCTRGKPSVWVLTNNDF